MHGNGDPPKASTFRPLPAYSRLRGPSSRFAGHRNSQMNPPVSRRALIGALGASALLSSSIRAATFPTDSVPTGSRELWAWIRSQLVLDPELAWLDTAGSGPALRAVMVREYRHRERQSQDFRHYRDAVLGEPAMAQHLAGVAAFLGASADEIAFTTGATEGLGIVTRGLDLQAGDEVLLSGHERPAAVGPWRVEAARRGVKLVELPPGPTPVTPEAIVAQYGGAITPRTRVLLLSHVRATDGTVMPVRELCALARASGAFSLVDGALGPGHVDVQLALSGCDAYATSFHRWTNASWGIGALFVRRDAQARVWPTSESNDGPAGAQRRYGAAHAPLGPPIEGVGVALEFQELVNRARIGSRVRELAAYLRLQLATLEGIEILTPSHPALAAGIITLRLPGADHGRIALALAEQDHVVVAHVAQGGLDALRVSVHPASEHAELDRCVNGLRSRLGARP
jgi:selenocysteine lyase/cysteine desulfurase